MTGEVSMRPETSIPSPSPTRALQSPLAVLAGVLLGVVLAGCGDAGESQTMTMCPDIPKYDVTKLDEQQRAEVQAALTQAYKDGCLTPPGEATSGVRTTTSAGGSSGSGGATAGDTDAGAGDGGG